jgi:ATP-dependent RNA helicase DDX54/DBP10
MSDDDFEGWDDGGGGGKGKGKGKPKGKGKKGKSGGFQSLGLGEAVFKGVLHMGYKVPTPVQRKTLPIALAGSDVVVMARTGSGKTAAFLVPVLEKLQSHSSTVGARAIILSPSRELAVQTLGFAKKLGKYSGLKFALVVGGDSMDRQFEALADNPDVIIATPGRLMHHLQEVHNFSLARVQLLVFDEADRLFEMGFAEQLREIMRTVPESRQNLLFSATMPQVLVQFARAGLRDPVLIRLDTDSKISENLSLAFMTLRSADKPACLLFLMREIIPPEDMTVVFTATRHHAEYLHHLLGEVGIQSSIVYGAMDQQARLENLERFRRGRVKVLLVTDVAARGIDVPLLNNVINYSFPPLAKLFVHRVGRAARQGRRGVALSLVDPEELAYMLDLQLFLGKPLEPASKASPEGYALAELTPEMVYYGGFPQPVVDEENEALQQLSSRPQSNLTQMARVCDNAMKQYRRTRPDPSPRGIERSKELERGEIHPLLVRYELQTGRSAPEKQDFIKAVGKFRPKETIFEVMGGAGLDPKVMGDVRRRVRVKGLLKEAVAHTAMAEQEHERELMPGSRQAPEEGGIDEDEVDGQSLAEGSVTASPGPCRTRTRAEGTAPAPAPTSKPKISRAEQKRRKRGRSAPGEHQTASAKSAPATVEVNGSALVPGPYADANHYIGYGVTEGGVIGESAMQPRSVERATDGFATDRLEEAMLDINADDALDAAKKKKMMHWDPKKRKFVKQSLQEMSDAKKVRNEAGVMVSAKKEKVGAVYERWKKRTHMTVGREGTTEEARGGRRRGPRAAVNQHVASELRDKNQIRKLRKQEENKMMKNVSKTKRASLAKKKKTAWETQQADRRLLSQGGRTRSRMIIRT